jgi:hypothetical protein
LGIAYPPFRSLAPGQGGEGPAIPAEKFIDLCKSFGGDGCQMAFSQLVSTDEDYLKGPPPSKIRACSWNFRWEEKFWPTPRVRRVASVAQQLGVTRARVAINGRRYEEFSDLPKWKEFANHWQQVLLQAEPMLKQHKLTIGLENHKEWLADELAGMLKKVSSPYLGACVDFGNNLALLEDSLQVAENSPVCGDHS